MTIGDVISLAAICLSIVGTGIGTTWFLATLFWKMDVRLVRIEDQLGLSLGREKAQRKQSGVRVIGGHRDYGEL